jgi:sulfite exporter TauE/SafE
MSAFIDFTALMTAFFVGLLGSGHCFGMCGGIAAGLGSLPTKQDDTGAGNPPRPSSAVLFNLGRVASYMLLGFAGAGLLGKAGVILDIPRWAMALRFLTAMMVLAIGLQFLLGWQLLAWLESAGAGIWRRIAPVAAKMSMVPGGGGRLLLGLCWGFLPCGLVYSVLLTASSTGNAISGSLVMLAFGIGTMPSMLGLSLAAPLIAVFLGDRLTRKFIGVALVLLAVLSLALMIARGNQQEAHSTHQHSAIILPTTASVPG